MPRRPSDEPLRKVTIDAIADDWDALRRLHGAQNVARVVRQLIKNHLQAVQERGEAE